TPELRTARARLGGLATAAAGHHVTEPGRQAAEARFAREVLEEAATAGENLSEYEVLKRAAAKRRLFYARLSFRSARTRAARAEARRGYPLKDRTAPVI